MAGGVAKARGAKYFSVGASMALMASTGGGTAHPPRAAGPPPASPHRCPALPSAQRCSQHPQPLTHSLLRLLNGSKQPGSQHPPAPAGGVDPEGEAQLAGPPLQVCRPQLLGGALLQPRQVLLSVVLQQGWWRAGAWWWWWWWCAHMFACARGEVGWGGIKVVGGRSAHQQQRGRTQPTDPEILALGFAQRQHPVRGSTLQAGGLEPPTGQHPRHLQAVAALPPSPVVQHPPWG